MISIPGSPSFSKLVMMSSAPAKSAGDARYTSQDPFIVPYNLDSKRFCHSTAMFSLRRIKALFLHGKPRPDANSVRGLPCKNKAFYSPETQHGRRVIKVY